MDAQEKTRWVCERAKSLGFGLCGVAPAEAWPELAHFSEWLERGYGGEMHYLSKSGSGEPLRSNPANILSGARSVILVALNYNSPHPRSTDQARAPGDASANGTSPRGRISRYAWGDDYHDVLGPKLAALIAAMRAEFPEPFDARWYVDTGPINERVAAKYAGLGWLAKNTFLINEKAGSWIFLGSIVTTLELAPSLSPGRPPAPDRCGSCTACLDACPTQAFPAPYILDARRCIAYLTIELRGSMPEEFRPAIGANVLGCDICQDVCPWNRKSPLTSAPEFQPRALSRPEISAAVAPAPDSLFAPELVWLASLSQEDFSRIFRKSAVKRAKWRGLVRNACVALGNSRLAPGSPAFPRVTALLEKLAASDEPVIAEHARWALDRLQAPASSKN